jgi:hypothetical protein
MVLIGRLRSPQGLATRPGDRLARGRDLEDEAVSGSEKNAFSTAPRREMFWSRVAFAAVVPKPKMTPWSSAGASSAGACVIISTPTALITIQTA